MSMQTASHLLLLLEGHHNLLQSGQASGVRVTDKLNRQHWQAARNKRRPNLQARGDTVGVGWSLGTELAGMDLVPDLGSSSQVSSREYCCCPA